MNLIFSSVISYPKCKKCGECCSSSYFIPLKKDEISQIEKITGCKNFFKKIDGEFFIKFVNNKCPFQNEEKLCTIHKKWGFENKPLRCQIYPYEFIKMKNSIFVCYTFSCKGIELSPPTQSEKKEVLEILTDYIPEMEIPSQIKLFEDFSISVDLFLQLENYLKIFLSTKDFSLDFKHRMLGLLIFWDLLKRYVFLPENVNKNPDFLVVQFLESLRKTNFKVIIDTAFYLMSKEKKIYRKIWWFLGEYLIALTSLRKNKGLKFVIKFYKDMFFSAVNYKKYKDFPFKYDWENPWLKAYFIHLLERKDFIYEDFPYYMILKYYLLLLSILPNYMQRVWTENVEFSIDEVHKEIFRFLEIHFGFHLKNKKILLKESRIKKYLNWIDKNPQVFTSLFFI